MLLGFLRCHFNSHRCVLWHDCAKKIHISWSYQCALMLKYIIGMVDSLEMYLNNVYSIIVYLRVNSIYKMYLFLTEIFYIHITAKNITSEWDILLLDSENRFLGFSWRVTASLPTERTNIANTTWPCDLHSIERQENCTGLFDLWNKMLKYQKLRG